jgi:hypothetical protein
MRTRTVLIVLAVAVALGQVAFAKHGRNDDDDRHPGQRLVTQGREQRPRAIPPEQQAQAKRWNTRASSSR